MKSSIPSCPVSQVCSQPGSREGARVWPSGHQVRGGFSSPLEKLPQPVTHRNPVCEHAWSTCNIHSCILGYIYIHIELFYELSWTLFLFPHLSHLVSSINIVLKVSNLRRFSSLFPPSSYTFFLHVPASFLINCKVSGNKRLWLFPCSLISPAEAAAFHLSLLDPRLAGAPASCAEVIPINIMDQCFFFFFVAAIMHSFIC